MSLLFPGIQIYGMESEAPMIRQLAHLNFVTDDLPAIIEFSMEYGPSSLQLTGN